MLTATIATLRHQHGTDTAYASVKRLVHKLCHEHATLYGGAIDDLISVGNEAFLKACSTYCENSASFSTWVQLCVWQALGIERRRRDTLTRRYANFPIKLLQAPPIKAFDIEDFTDLVGQDAIMVLKLVLDTPAELEKAIQAKGCQPRNYRSTIKQYLRNVGWTAARIAESFAEIKAVL